MNTRTKVLSILMLAVVTIGIRGRAQGNVAGDETKDRPYFPDVLVIQRADYSVLEKKYAACLNSENDGVVESALAHMAIFKLMYPVKEFRTLHQAIEMTAQQHRSLDIRLKARIVLALFETPELFVREARTDYASPEELFDTLESRYRGAMVSNAEK